MTMIPWKPKDRDAGLPINSFRNEMDRLFQSFFGESLPSAANHWGLPAWGPPIDVEETDQEILLRAEIPGVNAEELDLSVSDNTLVISGEKKESQERKGKGYLYQERRFGSFRREVALPSAVDSEKVEAEYKDGVLHVRLHKAQEALARKIQVKSN